MSKLMYHSLCELIDFQTKETILHLLSLIGTNQIWMKDIEPKLLPFDIQSFVYFLNFLMSVLRFPARIGFHMQALSCSFLE